MNTNKVMAGKTSEKVTKKGEAEKMIPVDFKLCTRSPMKPCKFMQQDDPDVWLNVWTTNDVRAEAEKNDLELTDEQAQEILDYFHRHYDYVWEVSWELMAISIEEVMKKYQKEEVKV